MIEGQNLVEEEQAGVGDAELVLGNGWQPFDLAHGIVGKEANGAGGEGGQSRQTRGLVAAERVAKHGEDVAFNVGGLAAFGDGDLTPTRYYALERREPDEGVPADLLAALDRFEEKALALRPRRAQEGRDGRFQIGHEGAADGDKRVCPGEGQELLAWRMNREGRGFHSLSVTAGAAWPPDRRSRDAPDG